MAEKMCTYNDLMTPTATTKYTNTASASGHSIGANECLTVGELNTYFYYMGNKITLGGSRLTNQLFPQSELNPHLTLTLSDIIIDVTGTTGGYFTATGGSVNYVWSSNQIAIPTGTSVTATLIVQGGTSLGLKELNASFLVFMNTSGTTTISITSPTDAAFYNITASGNTDYDYFAPGQINNYKYSLTNVIFEVEGTPKWRYNGTLYNGKSGS